LSARLSQRLAALEAKRIPRAPPPLHVVLCDEGDPEPEPCPGLLVVRFVPPGAMIGNQTINRPCA
jgi:hypothetical protein